METLLTNTYTHLDQKSKVVKTNSIAIGKRELLQRKICARKHHFLYKTTFWKVNKKINGGYKLIWKLSSEN